MRLGPSFSGRAFSRNPRAPHGCAIMTRRIHHPSMLSMSPEYATFPQSFNTSDEGIPQKYSFRVRCVDERGELHDKCPGVNDDSSRNVRSGEY